MNENTLTTTRWQDWTIVGLRLFFAVMAVGIVTLWRAQTNAPELFAGLLLPGAAAIILVIALGIGISVEQFREAVPFALMAGDWVLAGLFIYAVDADPLTTVGLSGMLIVSGILNLGPVWGGLHSVGIVGITIGLAVYLSDFADLSSVIDAYAVPVLSIISVGAFAFIWVLARERYDYKDRHGLKEMITSRAEELQEMHERTSSIGKMTDAITGTLSFEKILHAALNIGLVSLRKNKEQRVVSVALLFREDDRLYIADQVGLTHFEDRRALSGESGVVAEALEEAQPVLCKNPVSDPILGELGIKHMRSVLTIPLRAHYDNYGALIFACEKAGAFPDDHIHTLNAIAMQATVALQNAVLYNSLMADKARIIQMEEDARKSLVRDLHDVPTQTIAAVKMRLSITRRMMEQGSGDIENELAEIEEMTQRATEEIRHVLFKLRPLALESQGMTAALKQLADKMKKTYKQNVTVKVADDVETCLNENQQGALFYLIEEAINNARKYAEASVIAIQGVTQGNVIAIRIADNGKGFDTGAVEDGYDNRGSFGMVNMRERAELLDGTLTLKSAPGQGTIITVLIPIKQTAEGSENNGSFDESAIASTKLATSARDSLDRMRYD